MDDFTARLESLSAELREVEARLGDPDLLADQARFHAESRRYKQLEEIVSAWHRLGAARDDIGAARELLAEADGDDAALLHAEIDELGEAIPELEAKLRTLLLPRDPNDGKSVIVEIRGAEGGEEANLFARDLHDMYQAWAKANRWGVEYLQASESDMGGYDHVTFLFKGNDVWQRMQFEGGPHRVQRVPTTESQGRVHTSSATVTVLPEAEEIEVQIDDNDLQVDVYRASGPGGQSVNTTDSAVRITHMPTGIVVSMQDEKSQLQNKAKALRVLRARLLQAEQERQQGELSEARRSQVGGGGRSEKIRTYNYKENRLTDHRIGFTIYKLDKVLAGDLDGVSDALLQDLRERQLLTED